MDGLLVIDKPQGPTSHDIVHKVRGRIRRVTGIKKPKVGHVGTLDPFATGVLPLCIGGATRFARFLIEGDKRYRATLRLGQITDTDDLEGEVLETKPWEGVSEQRAREVIEALRGPQLQRPPEYSAIKLGGKRAYELARAGVEVHLEPRPITIHAIEVDHVALPEVVFTVSASKGTYIRAICRDVGETLEVGGHCVALRRLAAAGFDEAESHPFEEVMDADEDTLRRWLLPPAQMLRALTSIEVDDAIVARLMVGQRVPVPGALPPDLAPDTPLRILDPRGALVCVASLEEGVLKPERVLPRD